MKNKIINTFVIIFLCFFLCTLKALAYYESSDSEEVSITTTSYDNLTFTFDKNLYGNNIPINLTVTNPNLYPVIYTFSFSDTSATYKVDGSTVTNYTVSAVGSKKHSILITGTSNSSIIITIKVKSPYSKNYTKTIDLDVSAPTSLSITSTNNVATSQTATIKCSDTVGVTKYYWGTNSSPSDGDYTSVSSTTSLSTTKTVSNAGTYYLFCKDAAGNISSSINKTFYKTTFTMDNGTVSPTSVITMSGNSFTLPTPTVSTGYTSKGAWYTGTNYATSKGAYGTSYVPTSSITLYSVGVANTYTIGYTLNGGNKGTNGPTSGTYDSLVTIDNPTRSGYTFKGWTASNLTTSTAVYGTTTNPTTAWNGTTKVTSKYFKNLRSTSGTVTLIASWEYTATFYYWDKVNGKIASATASCIGESSCTVTIPNSVVGSTGQYGNAYAGLTTSTNSGTASIAKTATTITISANTTYYAIYSSGVTVYYPTSTSAVTSTTWYRNAYFTSTSAMATRLSTSSTGTSNATTVSGILGTYKGLATSANSTSTIAISSAATRTETTYYAVSTSSVTATFYYWDTSGSKITSTTSNGTRTNYCVNTTAASTSAGSITPPVTITSLTSQYGANGIGWSTSTSSMSTTSPTTANTTYYGVYRDSVTIYYPTSTSAVTSTTWYRNAYFTSTSAMATRLSTSTTGTSNATTVSGIIGTYKGLATSANSTSTIAISSAATRTETTYYAVSTSSVTATFYYWDTSGSKITSTTANGTRTNYCVNTTTASTSAGLITAPVTITSLTSQYGANGIGWANTTSSMSTTSPTTASTTYYAVYRKNVTIYYPTSTSAVTYTTWYRNSYFTSASTMNTVLGTGSTRTSNATTVSGIAGTYKGLATSSNSTSTISIASAATRTENAYYAVSTSSVTATFYYWDTANSKITSKSGSGDIIYYCASATTAATSGGSITPPVTITNLTSQYGATGIGWATSTGTMNTTSPTIANTTYYAVYSQDVTIYYPTSTSVSSTIWYRNAYFTSTSAMNTELNTSGPGGDGSLVNGLMGSIMGFATTVNSTNTISIVDASTRTETTYYMVTTSSVSATFYYQSSATSGTCNVTSTSKSGTRTYYCKTTSTVGISEGSIAIPGEVISSVGKYNSSYVGVATSSGTMSSSSSATTANTKYYAVYRRNVTNYYYSGSYTYRTIYRNEWLTGTSSTSCATPVLSTSATGTSNYTTAVGPGSSVWAGLATSATTTVGYSSVSAAAQSNTMILYTIYQFNVSYSKGANVSAIGSTSGNCKVTTSNTSCSVTLPTITANTGYTSVGWSTANGATSGTAASTSYTLSTNATTLYGNATDKIAPVCTFGSWSISEIAANQTATINLTCTDSASGVSTTSLTSSSFTVSNANIISIFSITSSGNSASRIFTITVQGGNTAGNATISLLAGKVVDVAGNGAATKTSASLTNKGNANAGTLYYVLETEANSGSGLAQKYTGAHQDSYAGTGTENIYHYKATNSTNATTILDKNNVIFAGFCWQMLRTTDTGGVKIIYNGEPVDGKCLNTRTTHPEFNSSNEVHYSIIANSTFNSKTNSASYVGYMYNRVYPYSTMYPGTTSYMYSSSYTYTNGKYYLTGITNTYSNWSSIYHTLSNTHYTCWNTSGECTTLYYIYLTKNEMAYYISMTENKGINEALIDMLSADDINKTNSQIKNIIDAWYEENMLLYENYLEDTIFCANRTIDELYSWDPSGSITSQNLLKLNSSSLVCANETDKFSTSNSKAKLKYPVGLVSYSELKLLNNANLIGTGEIYWTLTPNGFGPYTAYNMRVDGSGNMSYYGVNGSHGVRPTISLKPGTIYSSGDGSMSNPYVIDTN